MVDLSTLDIASLTFNGWILSLFLGLSPRQNPSSNHFPSVAPSWTLTSCVGRSSFLLVWAGFFFESLFLISPLLDSSLNIQLGISPPWLSSSLLPPLVLVSSSTLVFSLLVWAWQYLACTSHVTNYHRVYRGADTHITLSLCNALCSTGNPDKHWPMAYPLRVWSTICSKPELPGITIESETKATIHDHPCTSSIS